MKPKQRKKMTVIPIGNGHEPKHKQDPELVEMVRGLAKIVEEKTQERQSRLEVGTTIQLDLEEIRKICEFEGYPYLIYLNIYQSNIQESITYLEQSDRPYHRINLGRIEE